MNLFKNKNFMLLLFGWNASNIGTMIQDFAFSLFVLTTTGSAAQFSFVLSLQIIPYIIFAPFSGYFADKFDRKKLIIILDFLSSAAVLLVLLSYIIKGSINIYEIYICVIVLSSIKTFFSPVSSCLFQNVVKEDELSRAYSINSTISNIANIFSPMIAGALFGFLGIKVVMVINGLSFFISAICECFIKLNPQAASKVKEKSKSFKESMGEGFAYVKNEPFIKSFLFVLCMLNFILPTVNIGITTLANNLLKLNPAQIGIVESFLSIGMIIVSISSGFLTAKKLKLTVNKITILCILSISFIFVLSGTWLSTIYGSLTTLQNTIVLIAMNIIIVMSVTYLQINLSVEFQKVVPNNIMGRVSSFVNGTITACTPIGQILIGIMFEKLNYSTVFFIEAFLCLILFGITKTSNSKNLSKDLQAIEE